MGGKHHNSSKMSTKQKQSVIVNVHVGKPSKKKVKMLKASASAKRVAKKDLSQMIVRPIYQSIMAPQPMPTHHSWPPNVSETNSQVQKQNLQNELQHEQSLLGLTFPQHTEVIQQTAQDLRESLGLNHLVRGRETIPITTPAPIVAPIAFLPTAESERERSSDFAEMMSPRVDTSQFTKYTTYKNELFDAQSEQTPKMSSALKSHPVAADETEHIRSHLHAHGSLGSEHHGVAQRERTSVKKDAESERQRKFKHEYYNLYNKYEEVKVPISDTQKK